MKKEIVANLSTLLLVLTLFQITFRITPAVVSGQSEVYREVWKQVNVTNPWTNNTVADISMSINSRVGVYIAWSTNVTSYFESPAGYSSWWDWLNGMEGLPYHWGEMDWSISSGSLTDIDYDEIQHWGDMYMDSGGSVEYETFMGNTYMADWNLTDPNNDPDIIPFNKTLVYHPWQENEIGIIDDLIVPANSTVNLIFKIVMTAPGVYAFNVTSPQDVDISPSSWRIGGAATILVPDEYPKIQAAIDAASPGDTIIVDDGTYVQDLSINATKTNLEIKPDAGASVTIKGVQNVPEGSWPLALPNIEINADGVRIHGFTIESPDYAAGYYSSGMIIGASGVEIYDNTFRVTSAAGLGEISQAIQTYHESAKPGVDVSGLNIHNNKFTNLSAGVAGYEGIYINLDEGGNTVTVQYNEFTGGVVRAITTERSRTTIKGNAIITDLAPGLPGGYQGINVGGANDGNVASVSVTGNTINGSASGKGFKYGLKLGYSGTSTFTNVSVIGNTIQMNDVGVLVRFSANGIIVSWNNLVENTNYGVSVTDTTETVNATYNWWGDWTGPYHATLNPNGLGDNVADYVDFEPWLIQPYPPAVPVSKIYIDPSSKEYWTPAYGSTFNVNVKTDVTLLAGFEFKLTWDGSLLSLTDAVYLPPWRPYFEVKNETLATGSYTLALTGQNNSFPYPFNGSTTLATLAFQIIYDPVYPENVGCDLKLEDVILSDPEPKPIPVLIYNGTYSCNATKPKVALQPQETVAKKVPLQFDVEVNVTTIVNLYAFDFNLTYDPAIIEALTVKVEPFFNGSYSVVEQIIKNEVGFVFVRVNSISPSANGSGTLARVTFKVKKGVVWPDPALTCNIAFYDSKLLREGPVEIAHDAVDGTYSYEPIKGDLNMDGLVELYDLVRTAQAFGSKLGDSDWDPFADLIRDDVINILDIIVVASNFGSTS